jgi:hypothetical protein
VLVALVQQALFIPEFWVAAVMVSFTQAWLEPFQLIFSAQA